MPTFHLLIKGTVQGVFYRDTARKMARQVGVTGWIKNTKDGNVEAMASGPERSLNEFIEWCRKGPSRAKVEEVIVTEKEETPFSEFNIQH